MTKSESTFRILLMLAIVSVTLSVGYVLFQRRKAAASEVTDMGTDVPILRKDQVASLPKERPWVLVEYGNFRCTACKSVESDVDKFRRNNPKVKFFFRSMPFKDDALGSRASTLYLQALTSGSEEKVQDEFMALKDLTQEAVSKIASTYKLVDGPAAGSPGLYLAEDVTDAGRLKVDNVPAFFVQAPDGKTWKVAHLGAAEWLVRR